MTFPIVAYGDPVLRQPAKSIEPGTDIKDLIAAMFATMDQANGAGLAAPQIGQSIRLFVVDFNPHFQGDQSQYRRVYINPTLHIAADEAIGYKEEGCLSIPYIYVNVPRKDKVVIEYFDEHWEKKRETLVGIQARIVQHEYDHLMGKLHIDYVGSLKRRLLQRKLNDISQGKAKVDYPMRVAGKVMHQLAVSKVKS